MSTGWLVTGKLTRPARLLLLFFFDLGPVVAESDRAVEYYFFGRRFDRVDAEISEPFELPAAARLGLFQ